MAKKKKEVEASRSCIDFIESYCVDKDGHMFFTVTEEHGVPNAQLIGTRNN